MRVSREEMDRSHERIVSGASRLLRENGLENTSVADVMQAAGLTHGGFYRHFETKTALVESAIQSAFSQMTELIEQNLGDKPPAIGRQMLHDYYLSEKHLGHPGSGCPVATLAGDIARAEADLKTVFGQGVEQMLRAVALCHTGAQEARETAAIRDFARLVGAAVIARACDPEIAQTVLAACRTPA